VFSLGSSSTIALGAADAGSTAGATLGAGRTYLAPNDEPTACGQAWSVFDLSGNAPVFQDRFDPVFGGGFCHAVSVARLLTVPDGSFVVSVNVDCGAAAPAPGYVVLRVSASGVVAGSYVYNPGVAGPTQPAVLAALVNGSVVTIRNDPPNTVFELWALDDSAPSATARVPGLYLYRPTPARLGSNVQPGGDGSFSVLLSNAALGDVVLHVGPGLKPRFIYRYPRVVNVGGISTLISDPALGNVYYVDPTNNDIVALKRF
jgi:hypothetical protein